MLYAEYESYHFLSISLSAYVRKNPMTARESSAGWGEMKCPCVHRLQSAGNRLKPDRLLLLFQIIRWKMSVRLKNVRRPFHRFYSQRPQWHLLTGNSVPEAARLWEITRAAVKLRLNLASGNLATFWTVLWPDVCCCSFRCASVLLATAPSTLAGSCVKYGEGWVEIRQWPETYRTYIPLDRENETNDHYHKRNNTFAKTACSLTANTGLNDSN